MDLPHEPREWNESDLKLFRSGERKAVVLRRLSSDEGTFREELSTKEDWDNWFSRAPGVSPSWDKLLPGIYVIMCSRAGAIFEEEGQAPANYLPMPKPTWNRITREFHVHREITRTILRDVACFSYLPHHDLYSRQIKLGFTARMATTLPNDLALSSTYIPSTGSTFAVVYGCTEKQMSDIEARIRRSNEQRHHPLLMSGIFIELERKRVIFSVDKLVDEFTLKSDELESEPWNMDPKADEDGQKTQKDYLNVCRRSRSLIDHIQASKRQLSKFLDEIDEVAEELQSLGPEAKWAESPAMQTKLGAVGRDMRKRVQDIIREYDDNIDECNKVVYNTSLAVQTVWNHKMRQDSLTTTQISKANRAMAFDTRHESAQMRTIAILTMIYLPLSSVAAIFSMDMFNWEAGAGESIVSKHIWLFAVLTVGLTFLTLVAWRVGTQRSKDVTKKADRYFAELQRQGSFV
ncbi:hypothetical protein CGMCC3_g15089 [Colletotrichum fructicola]|nr:uncharacterized protein CGMCC3_g15089 [Colletotrichum fructicola]KAE9568798.1 hypothetical protein CGMCC3_g15089 [Colletotrichum fructicola]KAF4431877.1 hypothetical protein CFRS1_v012484 [Colletotrichum fructicola]KAF5509016.1 hypothetical protein CGCF413_v002133 [Colletotrichum fructicola]